MFDRALEFIFAVEGHISDHPYDRGGRTVYGVSSTFAKKVGINLPTTKEEARKIYKTYFWDNANLPLIESISPKTAGVVFVCSVLIGAHRAARFFQSTLKSRFKINIDVDGKIGPKTAAALKEAIQKFSEEEVIERFLTEVLYYLVRVAEVGNNRVFLNGWIWRIIKTATFFAK